MVKITPLRQSRIDNGVIEVKGTPIQEIIENLNFIDTIVYMVLDRMPSQEESKLLESYLVSMCDHGDTSPSTIGPRVASNTRASFPMAMINHISLASGDYHFGALELAMKEIKYIDENVEDLESYIDNKIKNKERLWGFGHRFHETDPRVTYLSQLAEDLGYQGKYMELSSKMENILYDKKKIRRNIDGFGGPLLADMGFPSEISLLFTTFGRMSKIARQHIEETQESPGKYIGLVDRTYSNSQKKEAISK
jgi:citrate synthase